ncbi:MAG: ATP-binding protein [Candidatus Thiodiazotropha taylori]|nr:ATP-binding protein [Candidatus Thiodiazotropha taylori]
MLTIFQLLSFNLLRKQIEEHNQQLIISSLNSTSNILYFQFKNIESTLEKMLSSEWIQNYRVRQQEELIQELFYNYRNEFINVRYINSNSMQLLDGAKSTNEAPKYWGKHELWLKAKANPEQLQIGRPYTDGKGHQYVDVAYMALDYFDEEADALIASLSVSEIYGLINQYIPKNYEVSIFNWGGLLQAYPQRPTPSIIDRTMLAGYQYRGEEWIAGSIVIEPWEIEIYVMVPLQTLEAPLHELNQWIVLSVIISVVILVLFSGYLARIFTNPVNKLQQVIQRFRDGDRFVRSEVLVKNEIGELSSNFNQLASEQERLVNELKKTEGALLKALQKAEMATEAKSEFLAHMSHELRSPLNAILGFSQLLSQDPGISLENRRKIEIIKLSGDQLLSMINDVLDLSKIEAGVVELKPDVVNVRTLLEDLRQIYAMRAGQEGLAFKLILDKKFPSYIEVDEHKLRQILNNLLSNAVKFTKQGEISIRASIPQAKKGHQNVILEFEVTDTGPGIAAEEQAYIFQPFIQGSQAESSMGAGLGLDITRSFVELMGGNVWVESEVDLGASFHVQIPVVLKEKHLAKNPPIESRRILGLSPDQPDWRILIVEDNYENALLLSEILTKVGFDVQTAINGYQAVEMFRTWCPNLIWMDLRMPIMDGYEATRRIRKLSEGESVKIIAVTASSFTDEHLEILEAGCDGVVHKPFQDNTIYEMLAEQLGVIYEYEEVSPANLMSEIDEEELRHLVSNLSPSLKQSLHEVIKDLNTKRVKAVLDTADSSDSKAAAAIRVLVDEFRFDRIQNLLKEN